MKNLNAKNLKQILWETLNEVKSGNMESGQADSIATQSREILRTVNTQLRVMQQAKRNVGTELIDFAENTNN